MPPRLVSVKKISETERKKAGCLMAERSGDKFLRFSAVQPIFSEADAADMVFCFLFCQQKSKSLRGSSGMLWLSGCFFTTTRTTRTTFLECPADRHLTNMFKSDKSIVLLRLLRLSFFFFFTTTMTTGTTFFCGPCERSTFVV